MWLHDYSEKKLSVGVKEVTENLSDGKLMSIILANGICKSAFEKSIISKLGRHTKLISALCPARIGNALNQSQPVTVFGVHHAIYGRAAAIYDQVLSHVTRSEANTSKFVTIEIPSADIGWIVGKRFMRLEALERVIFDVYMILI